MGEGFGEFAIWVLILGLMAFFTWVRKSIEKSAAGEEGKKIDVAQAVQEKLRRYMDDRQSHGWPEISQRRFGLIMRELGYVRKSRCKTTGRTQYEGLAWRSSETQQSAA